MKLRTRYPRHTCGLSFLRRILDGTSKRMYGTKKMTSAVLYLTSSLLAIPSSADRPKTLAFAMLTLAHTSGPNHLGSESRKWLTYLGMQADTRHTETG